MNVGQKAIKVIEAAKRRLGSYPERIVLTLYDLSAFTATHPGQDFSDHQRQRAEVVAWCETHGIRIIDHKVAVVSPSTARGRARAAVESQPFYRLGLRLDHMHEQHKAAIGWAALSLPTKIASGEG